MLFPWGTDAPIYYRPFMTGALILLNLAIGIGQATGAVDTNVYSLVRGDGLHPLQWVTHNFLHAGAGPLISNMLFLWAFGIVAEGKLGWWRFLLVYLVIGTLHGASVQLLSLNLEQPRHMLGSSAVISGIMAMCLVWAPLNEITCHIVLGSFGRVGYFQWDAPIYVLSGLYLGMDLFWLALGGLSGLSIGSALGHLSGALWGFLIATGMLKLGWVDCEDWDMYTRLKKRAALGAQWKQRGENLKRKKKAPVPKMRVADEVPRDADDPASAASRLVQKHVDNGDYDAAVQAIDQSARRIAGWPLRSDLLTWISRMQQDGAIETSIPLMRMYCDRFPEQADRVRLKLAQIYLTMNKHQSAGRLLEQIDRLKLPAELQRVYGGVDQRVRQLQAEGAYEIEE